MVEIYLAGYMSDKSALRFNALESFLEENGFVVYNPVKYILPTEKKAMKDFSMLDKADVLFVVTDRISIGTFIEIGYMSYRKRKGEDVLIILCYLGKDKYKGKDTIEFLRNYSPMTYYVDYITDDLNDALEFLKEVKYDG